MALETVVFQQNPFSYDCHLKDSLSFKQKDESTWAKSRGFGFGATCSSSDHNGFAAAKSAPPCRRKRQRRDGVKNREEVEHQRMNHIMVERKRRKQMNDYLGVLKSMMPASYVQRGDQASIIGGAIDYVKELEQLLQSLESRKIRGRNSENYTDSSIFSGFFYFPKYSTSTTNTRCAAAAGGESATTASSAANVQVTMVGSHANLKILTKKHPEQLLKMVNGIQSLGFLVLHLNVTSVENLVLYSFSVKIEDGCKVSTVNEIAEAVYKMVDRFQEESSG
ncbi:Basic helix-loop-helix DNA-binding superfamily protein [Hibiscus syriacus]|uniref:Basic helix-loop-helix DNA-binding superfamily protein n=1 Tax=Hibiscus syriacus TaxID=106335 RepID=A0A6A3BR89_HIBSY|nr:transcription factor bHLH94-like [Hibiscus syriacus]KAE8718537.1 Basic helix-loop-helix DNA-binding superfamily protein [Hibiscus syriacus]